jgi:hypothetical protein
MIMSDFNLDPYEPYVDPEEGENLDPNSQLAEGSYVYPEYAKEYGAGKAALIGTGRGMTKFGRGTKDLLLAGMEMLYGKDSHEHRLAKQRRAELAKKTAEEDKMWEEGLGNKQSGVSGWAKGGEFAGEVLPSFAVPGSGARTLVQRALSNAARQGTFNTATTQGNLVDRGSSGLTAAVGGGLGSVAGDFIGKSVAAGMGRWGDDSIKAMNDKLNRLGLEPRIGDLAKADEASVIRGMENWSSHTPIGSGDFVRQQQRLATLINPDDTGRNVITEAVKTVDKGVSQKSGVIWKPFDTFVTKHPNLPKVPPHNLREALLNITKHDRDFLNGIPDEVIRTRLINLVESPKNKVSWIPMSEYNEIRKALGSMTPSIKAISTPVPGATKIVDKKLPIRFADVLGGMNKDINLWGTFKGVGNGKELFDNAMGRWKKEILPWKESTVAPKLRDISDFGSSDTAKVVGSERDLLRLGNVQKYLREYAEPTGADLMDALVTMQRHSHALGEPIVDTVHAGSGLGAIIAPGLMTGAATSAKMSAGNLGKSMYFGDSMPLMTSPVMRGYLGASGETGDDQLSTLMIIKQLYDQAQQSLGAAGIGGERSIGAQTEDNAAGRK